MKDIRKLLIGKGYRVIKKSKDILIFEKGESLVKIDFYTVKHHKSETFKEASDRMFKQTMA
jgi:hypothetical protein